MYNEILILFFNIGHKLCLNTVTQSRRGAHRYTLIHIVICRIWSVPQILSYETFKPENMNMYMRPF